MCIRDRARTVVVPVQALEQLTPVRAAHRGERELLASPAGRQARDERVVGRLDRRGTRVDLSGQFRRDAERPDVELVRQRRQQLVQFAAGGQDLPDGTRRETRHQPVEAYVVRILDLHPLVGLGEVHHQPLPPVPRGSGERLGQRRVPERLDHRPRPARNRLRPVRAAGGDLHRAEQHQVVEPPVVHDDPVRRIDDLDKNGPALGRDERRVPRAQQLRRVNRLVRGERPARGHRPPGSVVVDDAEAPVDLVGDGHLRERIQRRRPGLRVVEELLDGPRDEPPRTVDDQAAARERDRRPGAGVLTGLGVVVDRERQARVTLRPDHPVADRFGQRDRVEDVVEQRHGGGSFVSGN